MKKIPYEKYQCIILMTHVENSGYFKITDWSLESRHKDQCNLVFSHLQCSFIAHPVLGTDTNIFNSIQG